LQSSPSQVHHKPAPDEPHPNNRVSKGLPAALAIALASVGVSTFAAGTAAFAAGATAGLAATRAATAVAAASTVAAAAAPASAAVAAAAATATAAFTPAFTAATVATATAVAAAGIAKSAALGSVNSQTLCDLAAVGSSEERRASHVATAVEAVLRLLQSRQKLGASFLVAFGPLIPDEAKLSM
jgi:hypothetical protein